MRVSEIKIGDRFGKLTVISTGPDKLFNSGIKVKTFICRCDCGEYKDVVGKYLVRGETSTCGKCRVRRLTSSKHYHRADRILARCRNPNDDNYKYYGGRGIMCKLGNTAGEVAAVLDTLEGYFQGATIDRIDPNGHYEIGNIRWSSIKEQNLNKRNTLTKELISSKSRNRKDFKVICKIHNWDPEDFHEIRDNSSSNYCKKARYFYILKRK